MLLASGHPQSLSVVSADLLKTRHGGAIGLGPYLYAHCPSEKATKEPRDREKPSVFFHLQRGSILIRRESPVSKTALDGSNQLSGNLESSIATQLAALRQPLRSLMY